MITTLRNLAYLKASSSYAVDLVNNFMKNNVTTILQVKCPTSSTWKKRNLC
jgi:hypothetical protein